MPRGG